MERRASATWRGGLKDGKGFVSVGSGVLKDVPLTFTTRFEDTPGTNPEELVAAAHAGCFSMALSNGLGQSGLRPESLETKSTLTFEKTDAGWTVTRIALDVAARVPGATGAQLQKAAEGAKANCPISRLLRAEISVKARLA